MTTNKSRQPGRLHFRQLHDYDSEALWVSRRFNDCDWPLWIFIRLTYLDECISENEWREMGGRYFIDVLSVSPNACKESHSRAMQCCGVMPERWEEMDEIAKCEVLISYGVYATLSQETGNNRETLLREAREFCQSLPFTIGFSLDCQQNRIGSNGWDLMQGDSLAGLRRYAESNRSDDPTMNLMQKISGQ